MTGDPVQPPLSPSGPRPSLSRIGSGYPVVVVDAMTGNVPAIREMAAALAPYPPGSHYYPGIRRLIDEHDEVAWGYVQKVAQASAPYVAGAFDCEGFTVVGASFSLVTTRADQLRPPQRAPHFDGTDPDLIAMLHYLGDAPDSGTAFFRHRSTGIEQVTDRNVASFVADATREVGIGYIQGSNDYFQETARFEAVPDRLLIYQGSLLHSGIIPPALVLSADPLVGRLTANIFVQVNR